MQCMRCGRDTEADQVFCPDCLDEMKNYPVKPDTPVVLPHYGPNVQLKKSASKRTLTNEELTRKLKRRTRLLSSLLSVAVLLALGFGYIAVTLYEEYSDKFLPGQNYSAVKEETTAPSTESVPEASDVSRETMVR